MIRINNTQYVHFLEQADALRRSGQLCDATISVRNQIFRAHRLVLACASRRLAEQLALGGGDRCTLESFSPRTFKQVLDFAYTRALEVTRDDLQLLLRAAEVLEMQPLEEQCRKQLESIHDENSEVGEAGEESGTQSEQKPRGGPHRHEEVGEALSEACDSIVVEDISPSDPAGTPDSPQPPGKKARPPLAAPFDRVSVISRHPGSAAPFSSPWIFPSTWKSVSTLRRLADYSGFFPFHPLQPLDQSTIAYPIPYTSTTQHGLPLLGSHLQSPAVAFSDYARALHTGSAGIESIIKQGLQKRKKALEKGSRSRSVMIL